jgi:hypothetical protein
MCARVAKAPSCSGFTIGQIRVNQGRMPAFTRQKKITFGEMRAAGVRNLLVYRSSA